MIDDIDIDEPTDMPLDGEMTDLLPKKRGRKRVSASLHPHMPTQRINKKKSNRSTPHQQEQLAEIKKKLDAAQEIASGEMVKMDALPGMENMSNCLKRMVSLLYNSLTASDILELEPYMRLSLIRVMVQGAVSLDRFKHLYDKGKKVAVTTINPAMRPQPPTMLKSA